MISAIAHAVMSSTWGRYIMKALAVLAGVGEWSEVVRRDGLTDQSIRQAVEAVRSLSGEKSAGPSGGG